MNSRPSWSSSAKTGRNDADDHQQAEEQRRADLLGRRDQRRAARLARFQPFDMLVRVLDHHDRRIDHRAERDRDAAEAHDVGADAERVHPGEGHQHADRQGQDRHQRAADMQQEDDADRGDDQALLEQGVLERVDRAVDQLRAVIDRLDRHALGQARLQLVELGS